MALLLIWIRFVRLADIAGTNQELSLPKTWGIVTQAKRQTGHYLKKNQPFSFSSRRATLMKKKKNYTCKAQ